MKSFIILGIGLVVLACNPKKSGHSNELTPTEKKSINPASAVEDSLVERTTQDTMVTNVLPEDTLKNVVEITKKSSSIVSKPKVKIEKPKIFKKKKPVKKSPKIVFQKISHDFGEITEGDIIEFDFPFLNEGNGALSITNAKGTCGCARPSFPFLDIAPGEKGVIGVTYNSVGKEAGPQKAEIKVTTNQVPSIVTLYLSGTIKEKISSE